jgi:Putative methyltransferase
MRKERRRAPILLALLLCCSIGFDDQVAMTPVVSISVSVPCCMSRVDAVHMMDTLVLPLSDKGTRIQLSSTLCHDNTTTNHRLENVLTSTDPLLYDTYGEFPLSSLDILLDRAVELRDSIGSVLSTDDPSGRHRKLKVVDLGSGCGRLALYMALTRPDWHVIGIEQSSSLHQEAVSAVQRTIQLGPWTETQPHSLESMDLHNSMPQSQSELTLILGGASKWMHLIHSADIIFCYSTAFESGCFSESISALLLSNEWHDIITPLPTANGMAHENNPGDGAPLWCITTDKALDPKRGWMVVDRIDVCNPEVFESTGFIQRYDKICAEETTEYSSVPRTSNSI